MILLAGCISALTFIIGYYFGVFTNQKTDEWVIMEKIQVNKPKIPHKSTVETTPLLNSIQPSAPLEEIGVNINPNLNPIYVAQN